MHDIIFVLRQSVTITLFVIIMMLIIEYLNVFSKGLWSRGLSSSPWKQILLSAVLGIIPGCLGAYTAVSLYVHNLIGTAALATAMIATSGDEAFFMFSVIPEQALMINVALFAIAIASGFVINWFTRKKAPVVNYPDKQMVIHKDEAECFCYKGKDLVRNFQNFSLYRGIFMAIVLFALAFVVFFAGHDHGGSLEIIPAGNLQHEHPEWIRTTFIIVLVIALFIVVTVNDHFIKHHIVDHVIRKHLLRIFLWTFGTLLVLHFADQYLNLEKLIGDNLYVVLLIAVLIGIIPQSGPHLMFVVLFASGNLPLSILLANSIVQDGHGSLPLLAESRKGFLVIKAINIAVGLLVGVTGLLAGM